MEDVAKRLFRYFLPVERETAQGEKTQGRGMIAADRGGGEALTEELFHQLGRLPRPLYWFTGWAQGLACGDVLRLGEEAYRVLRVETVTLDQRQLCLRALLERWEEGGEDGAGQ